MPRLLDHDDRERRVVEAAWRVIARDGLAALSVRNVAAEADLAPSSLRYRFPTQARLRIGAIAAVRDRLRERIDRLPRSPDGREHARALLLELLPLDDQRRLELEVYLALGVAALTDAELQPLRTELYAVVRQVCAEAAAMSLDRPDEGNTDLLHALVDGLAVHLLFRSDDDPAWAVAAVERQLGLIAPTGPAGTAGGAW